MEAIKKKRGEESKKQQANIDKVKKSMDAFLQKECKTQTLAAGGAPEQIHLVYDLALKKLTRKGGPDWEVKTTEDGVKAIVSVAVHESWRVPWQVGSW